MKDVKQPWELSTDERLVARFDPAARSRRVDAAMAAQGESDWIAVDSVPLQRPVDVITGSSHPELFLPGEVFATMIRITFGADDELARSVRGATLPKAQSLGLPSDFWSIVEAQSKEYFALQRRNLELRENTGGWSGRSETDVTAEIEALDQQECVAGFQALNRLRGLLGAARFNRFLYSVIAPDMNLTLVSPITPATLKAREEGCK